MAKVGSFVMPHELHYRDSNGATTPVASQQSAKCQKRGDYGGCNNANNRRNKPNETVPHSEFLSESEKMWLSYTFVFLLSLGIYSNSLSGDFVHDDVVAIVRNSDVNYMIAVNKPKEMSHSGESSWWSIWKNDYWGMPMSSPLSHKSYRPLTVLTFRLNYWMCGESLCPEVFHGTNMLIHAVVSCLTLHLSRGILRMKVSSSILVACLFAVHPIHTEAVAGITGRADALACLLMLISFSLNHSSVNQSIYDGQQEISAVNKRCKSNNLRIPNADDCFTDGNQNYHISSFEVDSASESFSTMKTFPVAPKNNKKGFASFASNASTVSMSSSSPIFSKSNAHLLASGVLGGFAMLAKETGITILAINIIYDICVHNTSKRENKSGENENLEESTKDTRITDNGLRKRINFTLTLIFISLTFRIVLMYGAVPTFTSADNPAASAKHVLTRLMTFSYLPVVNLWLILYPQTLSYDWQMGSVTLIEAVLDVRNLYSTVLYASVLMLVLAAKRCHNAATRKISIVSILFTVLPFLPASNLLFPVGFVVAERILYTPSLGICILTVHGIERLSHFLRTTIIMHISRRKTKHVLMALSKICVFLATCLLVITFGFRTWQRNAVWQSRLSLFTSGTQDMPNNAKMHYNYANLQKDFGNIDLAIQHYTEATRLWPEYASAHNNLGTLLMNTPAIAEQHFLKALSAGNQAHSGAHYNLGVLYMNQEKFSEAAVHFQESLKIDPSHEKTFHLYTICKNKAIKKEVLYKRKKKRPTAFGNTRGFQVVERGFTIEKSNVPLNVSRWHKYNGPRISCIQCGQIENLFKTSHWSS